VNPVMADRDAPVVTTGSPAIREAMGIDPDYVVSPGTYDQKHIDRIGRLRNCIAYGPGILELAHQPDEWISITDMAESAAVMALSLAELLAPDYSMKAEKGGQHDNTLHKTGMGRACGRGGDERLGGACRADINHRRHAARTAESRPDGRRGGGH